jgi:hypothetical protein
MFVVSNVRNPGSIKLRDRLLISKLFFGKHAVYEGYDKKMKRLVLEFIAENDIVCHLGLRQGLNSISFRKAKLIKLKEIDKYVLISV